MDYVIAGGYNDTVQGNDGPDLVFGDHGIILLYDDEPYKLNFAITSYPYCTPGIDNITLGHGNDIAIGGAHGDYIEGNEGNDIILGDFGLYDSKVQFLPNQLYESIIDHYEVAGSDEIYGGPGDDILMGQEEDDTIEGGGGSDDIYGGHHKVRFAFFLSFPVYANHFASHKWLTKYILFDSFSYLERISMIH